MSSIDTTTQPEEFDDERDEGSPEPQKPGEPGQVIDLKANPPEPQEGPRALTVAAADVPVAAHGAAPSNFAHQITLAQYMAKAALMVPEHFHGNVGDCLAIIDIATRAGLSPYAVAAKTYKAPGGKGLAYESQLYHAMLINSGWLNDAALHVKYDGSGDDRTCTVWGTLKGEKEPRYYTSPPLKDLKPGTNDKGQLKGSPLWRDKPDVQMFYDTSRDWSRLFAPIATLGMLEQYERIEHPLTQPGNTGDDLRKRLSSAKNDEGHKHGFAEQELAQVAADKGGIQPAGDDTAKTTPPSPANRPPRPPARKRHRRAQPKAATKPKGTSATVKAAADRAQARSDATKAKTPAAPPAKPKAEQKTDDPKPAIPKKPKNAAEYEVYAEDWINRASDPEAVIARWDQERDTRDDLTVRTVTRNRLRALIETKHGV